MDKSIIKEFKTWQKEHPNFMTPNIVKAEQIDDKYIVELSEGTDFEHKPFFGVTVIEYDESAKPFKINGHPFDEGRQPFHSKDEARNHWDTVKSCIADIQKKQPNISSEEKRKLFKNCVVGI